MWDLCAPEPSRGNSRSHYKYECRVIRISSPTNLDEPNGRITPINSASIVTRTQCTMVKVKKNPFHICSK